MRSKCRSCSPGVVEGPDAHFAWSDTTRASKSRQVSHRERCALATVSGIGSSSPSTRAGDRLACHLAPDDRVLSSAGHRVVNLTPEDPY